MPSETPPTIPATGAEQQGAQKTRLLTIAAAILALLVVVGYLPVFSADFTSFDDREYILSNPHVPQGLTLEGVRWAFTTYYASNWHPLSWLSHMVDVTLYDLEPSGHHAMNVLLHVLGSMALLYWLVQSTGRIGPALLVAAIFALHPIQVESVAWVAERKNVLSTLLGLLCLIAYTHYAAKPGALRYLLVFVLLALGLLAKPMLVTWPCVMLLLDFWPLGRTPWAAAARPELGTPKRSVLELIIEKLPLMALSIVSSYLTMQAQHAGGAVKDTTLFSTAARLQNATVAYARYLRMTAWPSDLAVFYPHPGTWPIVTVVISAIVLLAITLFVLTRVRQQPFLLTGWLFYLGTLVPVIGLLQVGMQAAADRYMNVPIIGLLIAVVFAAGDAVNRMSPGIGRAAVAGSVSLCLALTGATFVQASYWKDSLSLYQRAVAVTPENPLMLMMIGSAYADAERFDPAIAAYERAIHIDPKLGRAHAYLGSLLTRLNRLDDAMPHLAQAGTLSANDAEVQFIVGMAYYYMNEYDLSIERFQTLTKLRPTDDAAHLSLATALAGAGRVDEAVAAANKAIELNPRSATAYFTLGGLHLAAKRFALASESFAAAIDRSPALWQTYRSWAEAEIGRGDYNKAAKLLTAHLDAIVQQTGETDESAKRRLEQVRAAAMGRSFVPLKPMTELSKPTRQRSSTAATSTTTTAPAVTAAPAVTQPSQP